MASSNKGIKFRAWDKEEKKMYPVAKFEWFKKTELDKGKEVIFISDGLIDDFHIDEKNIIFLQFIGLKDRNKKEIYEGDIVNDGTGFKGFIDRYDCDNKKESYHGWVIYYEKNKKDCEGIYPKMCEVIGNIYENPKLL